jgi:D-3-phosphoglycerate dehydrogenase
VARVFVSALSFGRYSSEPRELLENAGHEVLLNPMGRPLTEDELAGFVADCEALIVGVDPVTEQVLKTGKKLKVVAKHGVGVDNIDLRAAKSLGITVTNVPGSNSEAVADFTFGLLLAVTRQINTADAALRQGTWKRLVGPELYQKTLGILGLGAIGKGVARRARGFSMRVLAYDICWDEAFVREHQVEQASLEQVFKKSDFVSLHLPLLPSTEKIINSKTLALMKPTAYLINAARGELVDENALYNALVAGRLAGAALDAFSQEPPPPANPLLTLPNVVVTPHIGAYSFEANRNMGLGAARNVLAVLSGGEPLNPISI